MNLFGMMSTPDERSERRNAIQLFWAEATTNFLPVDFSSDNVVRRGHPDNKVPGNIRYKTIYRTWEQPPPLPPPPRDTVMFVLAIAIFHINEATYEDQVDMPRAWDNVTGHRAELVPRLVFCGLAICLESEYVPDGTLESRRRFLREFGVAKRLKWLRDGLRYHIIQADWPDRLSDALRL